MTILLPTDNAYDIPALDPTRQGQIATPVVAWGSVSRGVYMPGTWSFYVDDYRFGALLRDPLQLTATGCKSAVEPNITLRDQTPVAFAIWATYQKRSAARQWQTEGIGVIVDLNVPERHREVSMLGVPAGWSAFATRGYNDRPDDLISECKLARSWSAEATILVYGGGKRIEALCREIPGAVYVHAHMDQVRGEGQRSGQQGERRWRQLDGS